MALLEVGAPETHFAKTCDSPPGLGGRSSRKSLTETIAFDRAARARRPAKGSSSTARNGSDGRGALRLARVLGVPRKASWFLSPRQVANIGEAVLHAIEIGLPLNRFVTINWEASGIENGAWATGRLLKFAGDWLRRHRAQLAYVWVQERGPRVGQHAHILLHVPPALARRFSELQRGWLKASGARIIKGLIRTRPVGRTYRLSISGPHEAYRNNLKRVTSYMLKQAAPAYSGAPPAPVPGASLVIGKRCSTSENIGATARSRARMRASATLTLPIDFG